MNDRIELPADLCRTVRILAAEEGLPVEDFMARLIARRVRHLPRRLSGGRAPAEEEDHRGWRRELL